MRKKFVIMLFVSLAFLTILNFIACNNADNNDSVDKVFEQAIDERLYNIVNQKDGNVVSSSNPYDYIKSAEGSENYKYIVSQGDKSLNYMLKKFAGSDKDGLEEYIMAIACSEILKEDSAGKKLKGWASGREWYDNYIKANK